MTLSLRQLSRLNAHIPELRAEELSELGMVAELPHLDASSRRRVWSELQKTVGVPDQIPTLRGEDVKEFIRNLPRIGARRA